MTTRKKSNRKSTHTSWPGILYRLPGRRWWCLWSSDPVLLLSVPRHQLGKRSCSVQFGISWGPALTLWSKWTGKHVVFNIEERTIFVSVFQCFNNIYVLTLTIRSQACLPSIKPFGIALGVRISYLQVKWKNTFIFNKQLHYYKPIKHSHQVHG